MILAPPVLAITVLTLVLIIGVFVATSAGLNALGLHPSGELMAFLLGLLIAAFLGAAWYQLVTLSGAANWLTGAGAERWTAEAMASLGEGWYQFSNVPFTVGFGLDARETDVDHLLVGPYGVLVIESKYSSLPLDLGATRLENRVTEAILQVERNANRVRAFLHRDAPDVPICPIVVYWGRQVKPPTDLVRREGEVRLVHGGEARKWLPLLRETRRMSAEQVDRVVAKAVQYKSN